MKRLIFLITALSMLISYAAVPAGAEKYDDEKIELYMLSSKDLDVSMFGDPHPDGLTDEQSEQLAELIDKGLREKSTGIDVSSLNIPYDGNDTTIIDGVSEIYANVIFEDPLIFYSETSFGYYYMPDASGSVTGTLSLIVPNYLYALDDYKLKPDLETISSRDAAFKAKAQQIADYAKSMNPTNEMETALLVHDYLIEYAEYDLDAAANTGNSFLGHGADSLLIDKTAVCQGYSSAYKYILGLLGIECHNAYDDTDRHEWSIAKLDGNYYHIDVTFDDPTADSIGYAAHNLFALTDDEIITHDSHSEWYTNNNLVCSDTKYSNAEWKIANSAIAFVNNDRYFMYDNSENLSETYSIYIAKAAAGLTEIVDKKYYSIGDRWNIDSESGSYLARYCTGLGTYKNCLYYNTPTQIMRIDTTADTPEAKAVYSISDEDFNIFGSYLDTAESASNGVRIYYAGPLWSSDGSYNGTDNSNIRYIGLPVKITFETNGGTAVADVETTSGSVISEPVSTRDFFELDGWYTDSAFTSKWDFANPVTDDMTLYAKWIYKLSFNAVPNVYCDDGVVTGTLKYDLNFGTDEDTSSSAAARVYIAIHENGILKQVVSSSPVSPSARYSYTEKGAAVLSALQQYAESQLAANTDMTKSQLTDDINSHKSDIAKTAGFDGTIDSVTISDALAVTAFSLTASDGIAIEYSSDADTAYAVYATADIAPANITSADNCTLSVYVWDGATLNPRTNALTYALNDILKVNPQTEVTVSFDTNSHYENGDYLDQYPISQTVKYGEKVTAPADELIVNSYMKFMGWYSYEALTQAWDFDTPVTENMTLYAKWESMCDMSAYPQLTYADGVLSGKLSYDFGYGDTPLYNVTDVEVSVSIYENDSLVQLQTAAPLTPYGRAVKENNYASLLSTLQTTVTSWHENSGLNINEILSQLKAHSEEILTHYEIDGELASCSITDDYIVSAFEVDLNDGTKVIYDASADKQYTMYPNSVAISDITINPDASYRVVLTAYNIHDASLIYASVDIDIESILNSEVSVGPEYSEKPSATDKPADADAPEAPTEPSATAMPETTDKPADADTPEAPTEPSATAMPETTDKPADADAPKMTNVPENNNGQGENDV